MRCFSNSSPELAGIAQAKDEVVTATLSTLDWVNGEAKGKLIIRVKLSSTGNDNVIKDFKALEAEIHIRDVEEIEV